VLYPGAGPGVIQDVFQILSAALAYLIGQNPVLKDTVFTSYCEKPGSQKRFSIYSI